MENEEKIIPTSIKIDEDLLIKIKIDAKKEGRSVSKQIQYMIKKYYEIKES